MFIRVDFIKDCDLCSSIVLYLDKIIIMKKLLLLALLLSSMSSFGQIEWEQTYLYDGGVQRIVLENSGEKYYSVNRQTGRVQFYNANHSPWKSVMIPLPSGNYSLGIYHISETKINPDNNIEILYSTYSAPGFYQCRIINELGTVLLSVDNCQSLAFDQIEGLPNKIISFTGVVYTVPGLVPEHTYSEGIVSRVNLSSFGEKYYVLDRTNSLVNLYNADHSFWKSIILSKPLGYTLGWTIMLSENLVNSDNLIEVGYNYYIYGSNPVHEAKIINENGELLLTVADGETINVSSIEGLSNKLIVGTSVEGSKIYSIPDFNLEHSYEWPMARVKLESSGEKYCALSYSSNTTDITVYNSDHTLWKTIATPMESEWGANLRSVSISENSLDADDQLEVIYTISSNTLDGGHYYSYIVKDDGVVILDLPGAYAVRLSEFPNLEKKLIVYSQEGPSFDQLNYTTTVYHFDPTFSAHEFDKTDVAIAPNPSSSYIMLTSTNSIVEAKIYIVLGGEVKHINEQNLSKIDVENLPSGIYLLDLVDVNNHKSIHKIIISH